MTKPTCEASKLRLARIPVQAGADRLVVDDAALRVGPAVAWAPASAVDARFV